tara:strand:- start:651 stop:1385 length:735 start_codon:yes stop_codon:yes gene_type:complete
MINNTIVLSLPQSIKRREFMELKLDSVSDTILEYKFFNALDGNKIPEYDNYANYCYKNKKKILVGEHGAYGCLMSYKKLFSEQWQPSFVIEDDVYFHKNYKNIISQAYKENIFDEYDIIYFGYNNYRLSDQQLSAIKNNEFIIPVSKERKYITCGTYAIWYSTKAISYLNIILQNMQYGEIKPIDHIVWKLTNRLKSGIINPPLCISEVRDSNIRPSRDTASFYNQRGMDLNNYMHLGKYEKFR